MDFAIDGFCNRWIFLDTKAGRSERHPGGVLNVTLGEQPMEWFRGFFVTLIFVGSLQSAARPTDRTEH
jgi:hypothetical protein